MKEKKERGKINMRLMSFQVLLWSLQVAVQEEELISGGRDGQIRERFDRVDVEAEEAREEDGEFDETRLNRKIAIKKRLIKEGRIKSVSYQETGEEEALLVANELELGHTEGLERCADKERSARTRQTAVALVERRRAAERQIDAVRERVNVRAANEKNVKVDFAD